MFSNFSKVFVSNLSTVKNLPRLLTVTLRTTYSSSVPQSMYLTESDKSRITFKEKTRKYLLSSHTYQALYQFKGDELSYSRLKELKKYFTTTYSSNTKLTTSLAPELLESINLDNHINFCNLDKQEISKLQDYSKAEVVMLSLAALKIFGDHFPQGEFYSSLLQKIADSIDHSTSHKELIIWAYISTLSKSEKETSARILRKIYERFKSRIELFNDMNLFETSILCNAWFANGVLVTSKPILRSIDATLASEIKLKCGKVSQEALSMLKVLRRACFASNELLHTLAKTVSNPMFQHLNLAEATHALALLADHCYHLSDDMIENLSSLIEKNMKRPIQRSNEKHYHPTRRTRIKDVTRFMWAVTCLVPSDHPSSRKIANNVIALLETALKSGSFRLHHDCHLLSDFLLSLACWDIYPEELIKKIVTPSFVNAVVDQQQTLRQSRLALFLTGAHLEAPHLQLPESYFHQVSAGLRPYKIEKELTKRTLLAKLAACVDRCREELQWNDIQCGSPIPHLNIAGLAFRYKEQKIAIEVFDSQVCMRQSSTPERLLAFKIRLLEKKGYRVYQLRPKQQAGCCQREAEVQDDNYIDQYLLSVTEWLNEKSSS